MTAKAMEAQRAGTLGPVHDSAARQGLPEPTRPIRCEGMGV
jgi:hypothetical protein